MGFFSKIKKIWKGEDNAPQQAEARELPGETSQGSAHSAAAPAAPDARPDARPDAAPDAAPKTGPGAPWRDELTLALRQAEPRLSQWLDVILGGVNEAGPELDERLVFLFTALEAPEDEARRFTAEFGKWLDAMGYLRVAEFKSELQYRLALALDLEDEEDERDRLFLKLTEGVAKTKEQITRRIDSLVSERGELDDGFWEELEEILIMADVGFEPTMELVNRLKDRARKMGVTRAEGFREVLAAELDEIFKPRKRISAVNPPEVVMMIGVNGVGKTTTIAKLAYRAMAQGRKVLIAAGDTFRAAAIEQLQVWAGRVGAGFYSKGPGADPASVAYEAMDKALAEGYDLLLLDTAGRLHTQANLMEELTKIKRVVGKRHPGAPHRSVLVIDATTGQNALSQTKLFHEAVGVDEIVLTKLDGTAKGGVVVAVTMGFQLPITFVGLGEKMEDLRPFDGRDFARALLGAPAEARETTTGEHA
jgi:fused signal recognition particle receptor